MQSNLTLKRFGFWLIRLGFTPEIWPYMNLFSSWWPRLVNRSIKANSVVKYSFFVLNGSSHRDQFCFIWRLSWAKVCDHLVSVKAYIVRKYCYKRSNDLWWRRSSRVICLRIEFSSHCIVRMNSLPVLLMARLTIWASANANKWSVSTQWWVVR